MSTRVSTLATRALRVALLTGGLVAVGTGVAAASDHPADDLDVAVPVTVTDNALAVLGDVPADGALHLPVVSADLTVDLGPATVSVPVTVAGNDAAVAGGGVTQPPAPPAPPPSAPPPSEPAEPADVVVPVTVSGNAVGVLGDAGVTGTAPAAPAGAVTVPVTVCGNGVGLLGDATGGCTPAPATPGSGIGGIDVDVPVTVCGNGLGLLGDATGGCTPPSGPTGPQQPTDPEQPGTPQRPTDPQQPGGPEEPGTPGRPATPPHPGTSAQPGTAHDTGGHPVGRFGVVTAADRGGDRTASAPRHLARVDGSGGTGGGRLAYTGTDAAAVLGVGLLALLLGTVLALASRRPGRTR
jgi:hypothetical protein